MLYTSHVPLHRERATVRSHLQMLSASGAPLDIIYHNTMWGEAPRSLYDPAPDAVILHNFILAMRWSPLFYYNKQALDWLRDLDCVKIALPQDEYDHAAVLDEWLYELGVTHVMSNFGAESWQTLYPLMHTRAAFDTIFTGYIDEALAQRLAPALKPAAERPLDIIYRARHLPYWYGSQGQLKHRIADVVAARARERGFICDISTQEKDTIYGERWFDFMASGRLVIGVESGVSSLDPRGEMKAAIQKMQRENPGISFEEVRAQLPTSWDSYRFFAIGPRHLEAVITKTPQMLIEGHYDGVLEAGRHYIPLKRDFSNLDEALDQLRDHAYLQSLADTAYQEVYLSGKYTYRHAADKLLKAITSAPEQPYDAAHWKRARRRAALESEARRRWMDAQNKLITRFWGVLSSGS
jgi:hypothetical protein